MEDAISILDCHGIMSLATKRPDGWPQATSVSFVNDGVILYFLISRSSQKYANIAADDRVSVCIASEPGAPQLIKGLSLGGRATECRDKPYRSRMLAQLSVRHPGYFNPDSIDMQASALMRRLPQVISIIDYSRGLGHKDVITVGPAETVEMTANKPDNWGANPAPIA